MDFFHLILKTERTVYLHFDYFQEQVKIIHVSIEEALSEYFFNKYFFSCYKIISLDVKNYETYGLRVRLALSLLKKNNLFVFNFCVSIFFFFKLSVGINRC